MKKMVIIPTYNERGSLPVLLKEVFRLYPDLYVMIVDDNSPDGTGELAESLKGQYGDRIKVLHRPRKEGLGPAYLQAFREVLKDPSVDGVVTMDADLSHDPRDVGRLIEAVRDADAAIGSRFVVGGGDTRRSFLRGGISRLASLYVRLVLGVTLRDVSSGFKCIRRRVLESLDLRGFCGRSFAFAVELNCRMLQKDFRVVEVPITFADRREGRSKFTPSMIWEALWVVAKMRKL